MSIFRNLMMAQGGWDGKPADWDDIRIGCPANSIALYAAHPSDYSQYDNLGFTATCTGGYNVFIDGTQYGSTYASGATCSITWSTSGISTGDDITTPSALKAHKIWIEPATEGNNITAFHCARVAASGIEEQGILWSHFNLSNLINLQSGFGSYSNYRNPIMFACTAKNNLLKLASAEALFYYTRSLQYSPILDFQNTEVSLYGLIWSSVIPKIQIKNAKTTSLQYLANFSTVKDLKFVNCDFSKTTTFSGVFNNATKIKILPDFNFSTPCLGGGEAFINNCSALTNDVILDLSNCTALNKFIATSTSKFKGLRVSSSAPFGGTSPQINVSNTSMDRAALVQLFNDLPYNVGYEVAGSLTINDGVASGFSTDNYLVMPSFDTSKPWEFVIEFITPSSLSNTDNLGLLSSVTEDVYKFRINCNTSLQIRMTSTGESFDIMDRGFNVLEASKTYSLKGTWSGTQYKWDLKVGSGSYSNLVTVDSSAQLRINPYKLGLEYTHPFTNGSIVIKNTYLKSNGLPYFTGDGITRTCSVVGCTGTADLTQADKDIALNKGWSLTLS